MRKNYNLGIFEFEEFAMEISNMEAIAEDLHVRIKEKVLQHIAVVEEVIQVRLMLEVPVIKLW